MMDNKVYTVQTDVLIGCAIKNQLKNINNRFIFATDDKNNLVGFITFSELERFKRAVEKHCKSRNITIEVRLFDYNVTKLINKHTDLFEDRSKYNEELAFYYYISKENPIDIDKTLHINKTPNIVLEVLTALEACVALEPK